MGTLVVGQKVILLKSVFSLPVGTFGFVVETYPEFEDWDFEKKTSVINELRKILVY